MQLINKQTDTTLIAIIGDMLQKFCDIKDVMAASLIAIAGRLAAEE